MCNVKLLKKRCQSVLFDVSMSKRCMMALLLLLTPPNESYIIMYSLER